MKVSVVIPVYTRAELLHETLEAILGQSYPPYEIIAVDDGSTDKSPELLARYKPLVHTIRITNSGDLVARNVGLRAAVGELVAFCDSDDVWRASKLAADVALFRAEAPTRFVFGNFVIVRDTSWEQREKFADAPSLFWKGVRYANDFAVFDYPIVDRLLHFQPIFPSTLTVRRDFFLEVGGWDEEVSRQVGCDLATTLRLAEHAPIGVILRPLVGIRKHAGNFSGDVQKMNLGDSLVLEHVLRRRPSLAPHATAIRASVAQRRREALDTAFARLDLSAVREIFATLPPEHRDRSASLKRRVAGLPPPVGSIAARVLTGTRSRLR